MSQTREHHTLYTTRPPTRSLTSRRRRVGNAQKSVRIGAFVVYALVFCIAQVDEGIVRPLYRGIGWKWKCMLREAKSVVVKLRADAQGEE